MRIPSTKNICLVGTLPPGTSTEHTFGAATSSSAAGVMNEGAAAAAAAAAAVVAATARGQQQRRYNRLSTMTRRPIAAAEQALSIPGQLDAVNFLA